MISVVPVWKFRDIKYLSLLKYMFKCLSSAIFSVRIPHWKAEVEVAKKSHLSSVNPVKPDPEARNLYPYLAWGGRLWPCLAGNDGRQLAMHLIAHLASHNQRAHAPVHLVWAQSALACMCTF